MDVELEVQELSERIAAVRAAIDEEKRSRTRIEKMTAQDDDAKALASLRDEVAAARARLVTLREQTPTKRVEPTVKSGPMSMRRPTTS